MILASFFVHCRIGGGDGDDSGNSEKPTLNISGQPEVVLPVGFQDGSVVIQNSTKVLPDKINRHFVPVGRAFEITISGMDSVNFAPDYATFTYSYDKSLLDSEDLIEDFTVFYYDETTDTWKTVERTEVNTVTTTVTAYTSHFTTFVLTAIPSPSGTSPAPPDCIAQDYPSGIGGSSNAQFTIVDENFKYYQDRDYFIRPLSESTENTQTFNDLGFEGALGISTFNGTAPAEPQENHKHFTGVDYITFTAHTDIDVYVMYDTRGGTGLGDYSQDASWLSTLGFTENINGNNYFIETTDAVQFYAVYKNSYNEGDTVSLHGNRNGTIDLNINTNYWVIIKKRNDTSGSGASELCVAEPDTTPPMNVTNLQAIPGATEVTLTWQNPDDIDFAGVVIRRSTVTPPMNIGEGDEPTGTALSSQSYRDSGLTTGTTYYYTVFSLDMNNNHQIGESISVTTSNDTDGDGLTDDYETSIGTNPNNSDSDGDTIPDGEEVANGTDPLNGDNTLPVLTDFTRTSSSPAHVSEVTFTLDGTDDSGITHWMITVTSDKPLSSNDNWQVTKPGSYILPYDEEGTYNLYAWAKDAAGNVSDSMSITIVVEAAVNGFVMDGTGTVISGALVRLYNGTFSEYTVSNGTGFYEFLYVPSGLYNLVAQRDGFTYFTTTVIVP